MNIRQLIITYSIFMGISIIVIWCYFNFTVSLPDLLGSYIQYISHMLAVFSTAFFLILSGILLVRHRKRAIYLLFLSMGMLIYTLIISIGQFSAIENISMVIMFLTFAGLSALIMLILFIDLKKDDNSWIIK